MNRHNPRRLDEDFDSMGNNTLLTAQTLKPEHVISSQLRTHAALTVFILYHIGTQRWTGDILDALQAHRLTLEKLTMMSKESWRWVSSPVSLVQPLVQMQHLKMLTIDYEVFQQSGFQHNKPLSMMLPHSLENLEIIFDTARMSTATDYNSSLLSLRELPFLQRFKVLYRHDCKPDSPILLHLHTIQSVFRNFGKPCEYEIVKGPEDAEHDPGDLVWVVGSLAMLGYEGIQMGHQVSGFYSGAKISTMVRRKLGVPPGDPSEYWPNMEVLSMTAEISGMDGWM
ncbi:hypothetical protein EK21DRAFT_116318 [Setomelanomma holmii]|uniref:Uncharacterized protein n=1 Tax=Setomelanomma holmii TaxID=210430 RepID=A0A9P4LIV3_9PLEO|nr:hypothetical protein EK21DRAFT_116318 [Setomelanomma holmii]